MNGITIQRVDDVQPLDSGDVLAVAREASLEVYRQDRLARAGKFGGTHILPSGPHHARLGVLGEEYGEVCRELNEALGRWSEPDLPHLRTELIQVAACAIAWAAAIDGERA